MEIFLPDEINFSEFLLKKIPFPIAIANSEVKVQAINTAAQEFFCFSNEDAYLRPCGEVVKCLHASQPGGCGGTPACSKCVLRNSVNQTLGGKTIVRNKGNFHILNSNEIKRLTLLVTTSPIYYNDTNMVLVLIEDISLITELEGLLPICSVCHKIRDEKEEWIPIETYIRKHSEAEFTHDYCPECVKKFI
ncbi:MAG: histidine kinase [Negativicutes bacterium]|nr:histidine kinase [Negativicutes bacterium]